MDLHDRDFGALRIDVLVEGEQTRLAPIDELDEPWHAVTLGLVRARLEPVRGDEDERAGHPTPFRIRWANLADGSASHEAIAAACSSGDDLQAERLQGIPLRDGEL